MMWPPRRVVVPFDFSAESFAAFEAADQIVNDPSALWLIVVLPEFSPLEPGEVWHSLDAERRKRRTAQALRQRLTDPKHEHLHIEVETGDPGHRIADFAQRIEADLIVMCSHGQGRLRRLLIGSVAERVTRLAPCPVLLLREA